MIQPNSTGDSSLHFMQTHNKLLDHFDRRKTFLLAIDDTQVENFFKPSNTEDEYS